MQLWAAGMPRRSPTRELLLVSLLLALLGCGEVTDPSSDSDGGSGSGSNASTAGRSGHVGGTDAGVSPVVGGSGGGAGASGSGTSDGGRGLDSGVPKDAAARDEDAGTAPSAALCDGSSEMRLAYQSGGGFVDQSYFFTNPFGLSFFAIDGMCRFYAGGIGMPGIASGTLNKTDADALSADVHWIELAGWSWDLGKDQSCPDAGGVSLTRAKISAGCSCGCDAGAPKNLEKALSKAAEWATRLLDQGKPLDGAVSALAFEYQAGAAPSEPVVAWPLSRSMSSIDGLVRDRNDTKLFDPAAKFPRFDDAAEAAKLRAVRGMPVEEGSKQYQLYVRDELPEQAAQAWDALRATVAKAP